MILFQNVDRTKLFRKKIQGRSKDYLLEWKKTEWALLNFVFIVSRWSCLVAWQTLATPVTWMPQCSVCARCQSSKRLSAGAFSTSLPKPLKTTIIIGTSPQTQNGPDKNGRQKRHNKKSHSQHKPNTTCTDQLKGLGGDHYTSASKSCTDSVCTVLRLALVKALIPWFCLVQPTNTFTHKKSRSVLQCIHNWHYINEVSLIFLQVFWCSAIFRSECTIPVYHSR